MKAPALPDRLKLYGGSLFLMNIDGKYRFDGTNTGFGSTIDFHDDLGGDNDDTTVFAGALYRFSEHHAVGFSWYDVNLSGTRTIDDELQIDDLLFRANGQINSKIDLTLYRFFYNWNFYHSEQAELTLSPGLYFGDFEAKFAGNATAEPGSLASVSRTGSVKESLTAPLPTIGFGVKYNILPRLTAQVRTDFFYVKIDQIEGSMAELLIGLEYRLFKHFALGAAYDRLWVNIDWKPGKSDGWEIDISWNGVLLYGALYF